jgi:hypothetical protein
VTCHVQPLRPSVTHKPTLPRPRHRPPGNDGPHASPVHEVELGHAVRLQAHVPLGYRLQSGPAVEPSLQLSAETWLGAGPHSCVVQPEPVPPPPPWLPSGPAFCPDVWLQAVRNTVRHSTLIGIVIYAKAAASPGPGP